MITYYADKECPEESNFPSKLPAQFADDEEAAKNFIAPRLGWLYDVMQEDLIMQIIARDQNVSLTDKEYEHYKLLNSERSKAGVGELKLSKTLCDAAKIRAREADEYFSHTRPNGNHNTSVLVDLGYSNFISKSEGGTGEKNYIDLGENLAFNSAGLTASEALQKFMDSEGHRTTLLQDDYTYVGVAEYKAGNKSTWVEVFA